MPPWLQFLLGLAAALNVVSFFVYGWDKRQARLDRRRIPEKHLLLLLLIGGWVGGWSGMQVFRHKTRKASFLLRAILATLPWLVVGGLVIRSALAGEGSG